MDIQSGIVVVVVVVVKTVIKGNVPKCVDATDGDEPCGEQHVQLCSIMLMPMPNDPPVPTVFDLSSSHFPPLPTPLLLSLAFLLGLSMSAIML